MTSSLLMIRSVCAWWGRACVCVMLSSPVWLTNVFQWSEKCHRRSLECWRPGRGTAGREAGGRRAHPRNTAGWNRAPEPSRGEPCDMIAEVVVTQKEKERELSPWVSRLAFSVLGRFSVILLPLSTSSSNFENFSRPSSMTDTWTQQGFKLYQPNKTLLGST